VIKIYCDRCGTEIPGKPETTLQYFIPVGVDSKTGATEGRDGVHLCPKCTREHAEWFKKGDK